jgi:hypothetical protein
LNLTNTVATHRSALYWSLLSVMSDKGKCALLRPTKEQTAGMAGRVLYVMNNQFMAWLSMAFPLRSSVPVKMKKPQNQPDLIPVHIGRTVSPAAADLVSVAIFVLKGNSDDIAYTLSWKQIHGDGDGAPKGGATDWMDFVDASGSLIAAAQLHMYGGFEGAKAAKAAKGAKDEDDVAPLTDVQLEAAAAAAAAAAGAAAGVPLSDLVVPTAQQRQQIQRLTQDLSSATLRHANAWIEVEEAGERLHDYYEELLGYPSQPPAANLGPGGVAAAKRGRSPAEEDTGDDQKAKKVTSPEQA